MSEKIKYTGRNVFISGYDCGDQRNQSESGAAHMKRICEIGASLVMMLLLSINALALEVPTDTIVQNLNGVQQYIKVYTVSTEIDPQTLIEDPFVYEGLVYSFVDITKRENELIEQKSHTEIVTVETSKKDLSVVLDQLSPTMTYDDGRYAGTLSLDHTTLHTEAAGYTSGSYTIRETKEIGNLDSNDMSYVPATTLKDGKSIPLESVEWRVQSTALVDDVLVPSRYVAIATYAGRSSYSTPTGYITTAEYTGMVSCEEIRDVTYTVLYVGTEKASDSSTESTTPARTLSDVSEKVSANKMPYLLAAAAVLLLTALCVFLFIRLRQMRKGYMPRYEEEETEDEHESQ